MLQTLLPSFQRGAQPKYTPPLLVPLIAAAEKGLDLRPVVQSITVNLGFDSFMYGISTSLRPNQETRNFVFTTLPVEWVLHYDQAAHWKLTRDFLAFSRGGSRTSGTAPAKEGKTRELTRSWTMQPRSVSAVACPFPFTTAVPLSS